MAFSPDSRTLYSASSDKTIRVWDTFSGKTLAVWEGTTEDFGGLVLSPNGQHAFSGAQDFSLQMWETASGKTLSRIKVHEDDILSIALSPDGKTAATTSFDGALKLWDIKTLKKIATLDEGKASNTLDAVFSPNGKQLLAGRWDKTLRLWDVKEKRPIRTWKAHENQILTVAISPDGKYALSGSRDNTVRLWELDTGRPLGTWGGHKSHVTTLAFSPDGKAALSGSTDYTVIHWDVHKGKKINTWHAHTGGVLDVAFSPDGRLAASAGEDRLIYLWNLTGKSTTTRTDTINFFGPPPDENSELWLGKRLFFDQRLSGDNSLNCASCHSPQAAFTDGLALSAGYPDTLYFRNTPTLLNASSQTYLYWDGRFMQNDLESLVRDHIAEAHFMNADGRMVVEKLRQAPGYTKAFLQAYGTEPTYSGTLRALTAYLRTLKSNLSAYDQYLAGDTKSLSLSAQRGLRLFKGTAGCSQCHNGPQFSDGKLHRRDVPENPAIFKTPRRHISFRRFFKMFGVRTYADLRTDIGHQALSKLPEDQQKFKTPGLREVARTAPYMHNGIFATLEETVFFENPTLSKTDVNDITAFLKSLSSASPAPSPPALPKYVLEPLPKSPVYTSKQSDTTPLPPTESFAPLAPLPPVPIPADNPQTPEKIGLGKRLFFDPRLSGDGESYCGACHEFSMGWGDNSDISQGYPGTLHWRNSQTLLNAAYFSHLEWDGAHTSLEEQARASIQSNTSNNADPVMIEERLAQFPSYVASFKKAFGVKRPHFEGVLKALAAFIRAVPISHGAPIDRYLKGDTNALSPSAQRGFELYKGKAGCIRCHNGALASDQGFHATGVAQHPAFKEIPLRQVAMRYKHAVRGVSEQTFRKADSDPGLYLTTLRESDRGKFRTPSLRDLKFTSPYMHNGIFQTLDEVIDFYNEGGGKNTPNKTPLLRPLHLSPAEKKDLKDFLHSMSGQAIRVQYPRIPQFSETISLP